MGASVRVYSPVCRLTLFKTIGRTSLTGSLAAAQRFVGTSKRIDLTQYLADGSSFRTTKSVRDPAGGFTIALADMPNKDNALESLYGLIEPMDMIELAFTHNGPEATAINSQDTAPVVMRGFVSRVLREESIGPDGRPQRRVVLQGQDYGKIWQIAQVKYFARYPVGEQYISQFKLFEKFGIGFGTSLKISDFLTQMIGILNAEFLANIIPQNTTFPATISTSRIDPLQPAVSPFNTQNAEGTFFEIMARFGDVGAWNELFIDEDANGVYCVYRPNPFRAVGAQDKVYIQGNVSPPITVTVDATDVISMSVQRSDENVSNVYWAYAPSFDLQTGTPILAQFAASGDDQTVFTFSYPNTSQTLYGTRLMEATSEQGIAGMVMTSGLTGGPAQKQLQNATDWMADRRQALIDQNKDNILFESGIIRMRGNETIRAGQYVKLNRGTSTASYYVTRVDHEYAPFRSFITTMQVERGTGFIERASNAGIASPYLAELARNTTGTPMLAPAPPGG